MTKPDYRRLDIWYVRLDPTEGSEARKTRPCLVLQNDTGNQYSDVTIVAPQRVRADRRKTTGNALHSASNLKNIPLWLLSNHRKLMD